jgi:hypothetical protein
VLLAIAAKRIASKLAADVGIGVGDTTGTGVGNTTGAGVGVAEGVGLAATFTPLLQTNLLPDLTQVYFKPLTVEVVFNLGQASPALTAAFAKFKLIGRSKVTAHKTAKNDLLLRMWG